MTAPSTSSLLAPRCFCSSIQLTLVPFLCACALDRPQAQLVPVAVGRLLLRTHHAVRRAVLSNLTARQRGTVGGAQPPPLPAAVVSAPPPSSPPPLSPAPSSPASPFAMSTRGAKGSRAVAQVGSTDGSDSSFR